MYRLQPICDLPKRLELPTVMYKLPQVQGVMAEDLEGNLTPAEKEHWENYLEVSEQQENVLRQLKDLMEKVKELTSRIKPRAEQHRATTARQGGVIQDLVITCDPERAPYSLHILMNWMKQLNVYACTHVHSSLPHDKVAHDFLAKRGRNDRSTCQVALTLIWKAGQRDVSLLVSPSKAIEGEANVARYLSRLMSAPYNYELQDEASVAEVDMWLDLAHSSLIHGNPKQQAAAVRSLENRLASADWLAGKNPSIADAVVWSAMQQFPLKRNPKIQSWFLRCSALA